MYKYLYNDEVYFTCFAMTYAEGVPSSRAMHRTIE